MNFKSQHDADRCGPLKADMTPAGELASVADVVRFMVARDGWPLRFAAALMIDTIEGAAPRPELFATQPGAYALSIDDAWRWTLGDDGSFWESAGDPARFDGLAGALKQLREGWVASIKFPADLDAEPCVRFAIRASVAAELFGYGLEAEAPPALPSTLPQHDAKRWGSCRTVEAKPRDLVRVADSIRAAMAEGGSARNGLAPKRAAAWVLDALAELGAVPWFELSPIDVPRPVAADREWRPAYPSGDARRAEFKGWLNAGMLVGLSDKPDADEAAARGLSSDPETWPWLYGDAAAKWPAVSALRGGAGVVEWLRMQWVERIASVDDLDKGDMAFLAVPARDVARLPWLPQSVSPGLHLVSASNPDSRIVQPAGSAWKHARGTKWTEAEKAALRAMRRAGMTDAEIAAVAGCTRQIVGQQIGSTVVARAGRGLVGVLGAS